MEGVYGHNPLQDAVRVARAVATNQLAKFLPRTYVRVTGETGRGRESVSPADTARYFHTCVLEYMDVLSAPRDSLTSFWRGRAIVEYGPGDIPGTALLLIGLGAKSVLCADRFSLVRFDEYQQRVIAELAALLPDEVSRDRLRACFVERGQFGSGLAPGPISYAVTPSGLIGRKGVADLVISRAVLEHVDDLPATLRDMTGVLVPGGVAVHKVDLKSHGLHRRNRLDFLTWPEQLWTLMFSGKGAPNRLRIDTYRREAPAAGLTVESLAACEQARPEEVAQIRPHLAAPFRHLSDEDLSCLSFWIVCRRP
jgi:hypothetical protein